MPSFGAVVWAGVGLVLFLVIWRVGVGMLRSVSTSLPPPPPPGELRRVSIRYRCSVCGMEIKTTLAPDEQPDPPRHCMEEMDVVVPTFE